MLSWRSFLAGLSALGALSTAASATASPDTSGTCSCTCDPASTGSTPTPRHPDPGAAQGNASAEPKEETGAATADPLPAGGTEISAANEAATDVESRGSKNREDSSVGNAVAPVETPLRGASPAPSDSQCLSDPVWVVRVEADQREAALLRLTDCNGVANQNALAELSMLARPHGVERPTRLPGLPSVPEASNDARSPVELAANIAMVDEGLLERLQALANKWPGRAIEIVSGYRPDARRTSRHHAARALDLRVEGVPRAVVTKFARTLPATGVGYYPNSTFTHLDVREESAYWVDRSGPGERPDYGPWPPTYKETEKTRKQMLAEAFAAVEGLLDHAEAEDHDHLHDGAGQTESEHDVSDQFSE